MNERWIYVPRWIKTSLSTINVDFSRQSRSIGHIDVDHPPRDVAPNRGARRTRGSTTLRARNRPRVFPRPTRDDASDDEHDWTRTDDDVYGASRRREKAEVVRDDANDDDDCGDDADALDDDDGDDDERANARDGDGATGARCATGRRDGADDDDDDASRGGQSSRARGGKDGARQAVDER